MIEGNLGKAPEIKETKNGKKFAILSIAENRRNPQGEDKTVWHNVFCWDVEKTSKLKQGAKVMVDPKIDYKDEKTIITARHLYFKLF